MDISDFDRLHFLDWGTELIAVVMKSAQDQNDEGIRAASLQCAMSILSGLVDVENKKSRKQLAAELLSQKDQIAALTEFAPDVVAMLQRDAA